MILGVDTGGTFTDFVLFNERGLSVHKVLSTPDAPEQAIIQGIRELQIRPGSLRIVHGSTVATNAVLEGKGVRTAYVSNRGFGDLLRIGRQARRALYDLQPPPQPDILDSELCLETGGRLSTQGDILDPLSEQDLRELLTHLLMLKPQAVAINLLFSFRNDEAERKIESIIPIDIFVSRSSEVLPEYKEYERGITTWLNAYIGPLVGGYLKRLSQKINADSISVMQSSGGTIDADNAAKQAVHMLLSGPAGGLMGAQFIGNAAGRSKLISFDMGGTSTDVALINEKIPLTSEGYIGPYPVGVPMVDMHTIGAGGGSIARVDAGGLLFVGPESAGADPGPACYGRGGREPTVTDANLILGRIHPELFLGGEMALDMDAAKCSMVSLAENLGCSMESAAAGIVRLANEHMAAAMRVISVQRGYDPREFTLISFGGAGGLHVCAVAEQLAINSIIVPVNAGVLSALGMLVAPRARQYSKTTPMLLRAASNERILEELNKLCSQGVKALTSEGVSTSDISIEQTVDLRYQGQSYTLNIEWLGIDNSERRFHEQHQVRYGHSLEVPVELINLRVALSGSMPIPKLSTLKRKSARLKTIADPRLPIIPREQLEPGGEIIGPAVVPETVATTFVAQDWVCRIDDIGNLHLQNRID